MTLYLFNPSFKPLSSLSIETLVFLLGKKERERENSSDMMLESSFDLTLKGDKLK